MKDLRTLLEASILDIEDSFNTEIDFKTLVNSKTYGEYNTLAKSLKDIIDSYSDRTYTSRGLKRGKPYIFFWENEFYDGSIEITFVDKWPITVNSLIPFNDAYYEIFWEGNKAQIILDATGSKFSSLIRDNRLFNESYGPYDIPKEYLKELKDLVKNAEQW
jgi:hypothetical protein